MPNDTPTALATDELVRAAFVGWKAHNERNGEGPFDIELRPAHSLDELAQIAWAVTYYLTGEAPSEGPIDGITPRAPQTSGAGTALLDERKPLTYAQVDELVTLYAPPIHPDYEDVDDYYGFVRHIEKAHGITGDREDGQPQTGAGTVRDALEKFVAAQEILASALACRTYEEWVAKGNAFSALNAEALDAARTALAAEPVKDACIGKDPLCPCQDGDACHYRGRDAWPVKDVQTVGELPPLPEAAVRVVSYTTESGYDYRYTADQMQAYAITVACALAGSSVPDDADIEWAQRTIRSHLAAMKAKGQ